MNAHEGDINEISFTLGELKASQNATCKKIGQMDRRLSKDMKGLGAKLDLVEDKLDRHLINHGEYYNEGDMTIGQRLRKKAPPYAAGGLGGGLLVWIITNLLPVIMKALNGG